MLCLLECSGRPLVYYEKEGGSRIVFVGTRLSAYPIHIFVLIEQAIGFL